MVNCSVQDADLSVTTRSAYSAGVPKIWELQRTYLKLWGDEKDCVVSEHSRGCDRLHIDRVWFSFDWNLEIASEKDFKRQSHNRHLTGLDVIASLHCFMSEVPSMDNGIE